MKLLPIPLDASSPLNMTNLQSEGGLWQVQANLTIMGAVRVNVLQVRPGWSFPDQLTDYCFGRSRLWATLGLRVVGRILESFPEEVEAREVKAAFPPHTIEGGRWLRPMHTDPLLWAQLCLRAGVPALAEPDALPYAEDNAFARVGDEEAIRAIVALAHAPRPASPPTP
jgi:hypothetical protein